MERKIFKNAPTALRWYGRTFKAFEGALDNKAALGQRIAQLRERGLSAISVNCYLRGIRAYLMGFHKAHGKELIRIPDCSILAYEFQKRSA